MFSGSSAAHLFNSSHLHNTATVNRDAARHFPSINDNYETLLGREASHGRRAPTERRFFFLVTGCVTQWRGTIDKGKMCVKGRTPTPAGPGKGQSRCQRPGGERERGQETTHERHPGDAKEEITCVVVWWFTTRSKRRV